MKQQGRRIAALLLGVCLLGGTVTGCAGTGKSAASKYQWSNVAIGGGGYVTGMEYNPKEEGLVYARTDIGGLYRRQKGTDWVPLTDFLGADEWNYIGIESMATDPVEPNRVYFAGGTYMNDSAGLFASDDYGETWTRINDDQHKFGNLNPKYITGDSNVYGRVYFCTDGRGIVMGDIAK